MTYRMGSPIQGVFPVLALKVVAVLGGVVIIPGATGLAAYARPAVITVQQDPSSNDGTANPNDAEPPASEDEAPSRDDTPQSDIPSEPPFGGCKFDRKPLQLMV